MPEQIQWTFNIQAVGGPRKAASQTIEVEAYDKIQVTVDGDTGGGPGVKTVEVQPGGTGQVRFLLVTAGSYDPPLIYKVDGGADVALDAPLLLIGGGAVGILGATQQSFEFTNSASAPNAIEILVGRDATP